MDTETYYLRAFDRFTEDFINSFSKLDNKVLNTPIAEGKWSPAQYVEHLILAEKGITKMMNAPGKIAENRKVDELVPVLELKVLKVDGKGIEAHEKIQPKSEMYNHVELLDLFVDTRADLRSCFFLANDISELVDWEHPIFGKLTKCEWLHFSGLHGERHRRQVMNKINL